MAEIILEPGEAFEHYHSVSSRTTLVEGRMSMTIGSEKNDLIIGKEVNIPAGVVHTLVNEGTVSARGICNHDPR